MFKRIVSIGGAFLGSAVMLVVFLHWAAPARAASGLIVVDPGESIQTAIDGASDGDTILITAGRYTESLTLNKPVSLTGVSSGTTILVAEPNNRVLTVTGATITEGVVISGLMVTGGFLYQTGNGGGVLLLESAHPSFIDVMFYDNVAKNGGGLWDDEQAATLYFTGTSFVENYGNDVGGAMYIGDGVVVGGRFIRNECFGSHIKCAGGAIDGDMLTISGAMFISNTARTGGAIYSWDATITNSYFEHNYCALWDFCNGGAIRVVQNLLISGSTFLSNEASFTGGAIFSGGKADIINSFIIGNDCNTTACWAGGLYVSVLGRITGTTFLNNNSDGLGGGIFAWRNLVVSDSVIMGNLAGEGGGVYIGGILNGAKKIVNSSIEGNQCVSSGCNGGGVWVSGTIAISGSTFVSNTAVGDGGAIYAQNSITIANSQIINNRCGPGSCYGGGVMAEGGGVMGEGTVTITGSDFISNSASAEGGGLFTWVETTIFGSNFSRNSGDLAGGAYIDAEAWVSDSKFESNLGTGLIAFNSLHSTNSVFSGNINLSSSPGFVGGGGMASRYLLLTNTMVMSNVVSNAGVGAGGFAAFGAVVTNSYIANNRCINAGGCFGGGIFVGPDRFNGDVWIFNSVISNNMASSAGGGVYASGPTLVRNSLFVNNDCLEAGCFGGGLATTGTLSLSRSIFVGNWAADGRGAALYAGPLEGPSPFDDRILVNNLFVDNTAGINGSAIYFESGTIEMVHNTVAVSNMNDGQAISVQSGVAAITNTIITSYSVGIENVGGAVQEDYNLFFGNGVNLSGTITSGGSSIDGDPDFVDPVGGDFHIGYDSAGLDNALDLGILVDLDGNPRPIGTGPDRGAYELGESPIAGLAAENDGPTVLGNSTQLTATVTAGTSVTYGWDFGDGMQGSGAFVSHVYPGVGVYTAVITASNSLNMMTATTVVSIIDEAIDGLAVGSNSPVQLGEAVVLTATITAGSNVSYSWDFGDGTAGTGQVVSRVYGMAGSYTVVVTATNSVGVLVGSAVVVVLEEPIIWTVYMPVALKP